MIIIEISPLCRLVLVDTKTTLEDFGLTSLCQEANINFRIQVINKLKYKKTMAKDFSKFQQIRTSTSTKTN